MAAAEEQPLPPILQSLLELVALHLSMKPGRWILEARFDDGGLVRWYRHEEAPASRLRRFEQTEPG